MLLPVLGVPVVPGREPYAGIMTGAGGDRQ
jgi:hypothetical protein